MTEAAIILCSLAVIAFFGYHGLVLVLAYLKRKDEVTEYGTTRKELEDEIAKGNAVSSRANALRSRLHVIEADLGWR